jgi:signal peptidase I
MLTQWLTLVAWIALPLTVIGMLDDWFLRPRRRLAALPAAAAEPGWLRVVYAVLPIAIFGAVLRMLVSEQLDFSLVLALVTLVSALVWALDRWLFAPLRNRRASQRGLAPGSVPLPTTVDYARSFLPVAALVLVVRAFIFEPFRIPSDSMMPTLLDGDFIVVNKWAYGLRLPVLDRKIVSVGEPQRGDVVVFHYPPDPSVNFIKRVVGLPGDAVQVRDDQLIINGQPVPIGEERRYSDGCYQNLRIATEQLGTHRHQTLSCRSSEELIGPPLSSCNRKLDRSYQCDEAGAGTLADRNDTARELRVPAGQYLMIGDNRDNSLDGRFWGFVPEDHLVGRAARIWFNWDLSRSGGPAWGRIGQHID